MAMSGTVLGDAIKAAVDAVVADTVAGANPDRTALFRAIGAAIVTHITANATVAVTVASVSGVTVGPGVSGPGAGSGTVA